MAPRPYWKGYLKLSLVSCSVALYPATSSSERISFNWLNRATGNRLKQLMVDSDTNEPVEREERVRGYQVAKNDYLFIEDDDLDTVEIESSHTIEIERFVPKSEIDPVYLDSPYYLAPNDKVAEEAFAVIRDAMAAEGVAGLGRAVINRRERLFMLEPRDKGIVATSLHYNYEVRSDEAYFEDIPEIKIPGEMLDLAKHIIGTKRGHFDIAAFDDRYESALAEMIKAKQAGRPIEATRPAQPTNVINLMEALRKSVAADKGTKVAAEPASGEEPRTKKSAAKPAPRASAEARAEPERKPRAAKAKAAAVPPPPRSKPERKRAGIH
ncbi:DNA repair protein [Rhodomicrobium udaipurense JA643]|uniref:Non-homologous end joining protein Ku n=1 Tax=Rhodomicrobium udaipurense TaxID=1202716 RepID=A0A8I1GHT9_9HYPH|nr:Ku protein [Rhodomicrobium udaipurense]KAI94324.1 DNA repair protein [Rhodomicrobium udaipurense JA643]MBJ7543367.1 Ku protein [Rhodomicrobium udaipurense]